MVRSHTIDVILGLHNSIQSNGNSRRSSAKSIEDSFCDDNSYIKCKYNNKKECFLLHLRKKHHS